MSQPDDQSLCPYTRSEVATIVGVSLPTMKALLQGKVLKQPANGSGNWNTFDMNDTVVTGLGRELMRVGIQVSSIRSLFEALQQPTAASAKSWAWLKTDEARTAGACLVLILAHRSMANTTGAAFLTTVDGAKAFLGKRTVIVIDVSSVIREIEERTGRRYE